MNIFELFGIIKIKNDEANNSIDGTKEKATKLAATFGTAFKTVGTVAMTCGKVVAAGVGAGAAAMGTLMKASIKSYAEYEQLVGGVDTLFKDSSSKIQQYAAEAYKNQGMSANQYMSTVTGFSASLIKSLKGDTEKAADLANTALTDMADNANKMGTSVGSIQDAYQGFAKQNYTMLDNLKLGYGGTKTEMQRLLKDAQKIKKAQGENVKYSINSFADIVAAIHVVQTELGITGTTAEEANETIAGSFMATSAAWQNLLIGIAAGNQDLSLLVDNFAASLKNTLTNIKKVLPNIVQGVQQVIAAVAPEIGGIIEDLFPALVDGTFALLGGLAEAMPGMLSTLGQSIGKVWAENVWPAIQDFFKINFDVELPDWSVITVSIEENMGHLVENMSSAITNIQSFFSDLSGAMESVGAWIGNNQEVVNGFLFACAGALAIVNAPLAVLGTVLTFVAANWDTLKMAVEAAITAVTNFFAEEIPAWWENSVVKPITDAWNSVTTWIDNAKTAIGNFFSVKIPEAWNAALTAISDAWSAVVGTIQSAINAVKEFLGLGGGSPSAPAGPSRGGAHSGGEIPGGAAVMFDAFNDAATGVKFNAKGAVFSRPTLFDTRLGKQVVGEAGPEAVAPIGVLQGYVADAVDRSNGRMAVLLEAILEALVARDDAMEEKITRAMAALRFEVNGREFARLVKAVT